MSDLTDAFIRQIERQQFHAAVDRTGWTDDEWIANARVLMNEPDGAVTSLLNGHVMALLRRVENCDE